MMQDSKGQCWRRSDEEIRAADSGLEELDEVDSVLAKLLMRFLGHCLRRTHHLHTMGERICLDFRPLLVLEKSMVPIALVGCYEQDFQIL